jgi:ABC-type uncharacterized transport system ATPase subunit
MYMTLQVVENYWFNMFLDDLPIFGMVGAVTSEQLQSEQTKGGQSADNNNNKAVMPDAAADNNSNKQQQQQQKAAVANKNSEQLDTPVMWSHRRFDIAHNGDRIVGVSLSSDNPQPLIVGKDIELSYEVCSTA